MDHKMFCFQCEQTAGCTGCTGKAGVCGKTADVAKLQDELTGALIGLARVTDGDAPVNADTWRLMIEGLFTTVTKSVSFNEKDHSGARRSGTRGKGPPCSRLLRLRLPLRVKR